jgi:hypothetical protein
MATMMVVLLFVVVELFVTPALAEVVELFLVFELFLAPTLLVLVFHFSIL